MRRALSIPAVAALCAIALAIGLAVAHGTGGRPAPRSETVVERVRDELAAAYYRRLPPRILGLSSVPAMLAALHDPYTEYLDPAVRVDGVPTSSLTFEQALGRILGPAGTAVSLEVRRGARDWTVRLVRRQLSAPSVGWRLIDVGGRRIGYLRLASFRSGAPAAQLPLAVVVDRWSASAAKVVAAALRDNGRATLVGESTFGKALVQAVHPRGNRAALKLTTARYLTPDGADISGVGVQPDVLATDDDALQAALSVLTR